MQWICRLAMPRQGEKTRGASPTQPMTATPQRCRSGTFAVGFLYGPDRTGSPTTQPEAVPKANHTPLGQCNACPDRGSPGAVPRPQIMAKKERYEIRVDDKFMEALAVLAERTGKNRADVIRDALNYYEISLNEWEKEHARTAIETSPAKQTHRSPVPA